MEIMIHQVDKVERNLSCHW